MAGSGRVVDPAGGAVGSGGGVVDPAGRAVGSGVVVEFDEAVGLGTLVTEGGRRYLFHCTQIAGGSRSIDVGAAVTFDVVAARRGTWEAAGVTPIRASEPAPEAVN